jgi:hypothetical protein
VRHSVSDSGHKKRAERQCRTSVPAATKKIDHCEMPAGLYCDCQGGVSRETPHVQDPSDLCCVPRRKHRRRGGTIQPITFQPVPFGGRQCEHLRSDALQRQSDRPSAVEDGGKPRRACRQHHRRGQRIHERLHQRRRGGFGRQQPRQRRLLAFGSSDSSRLPVGREQGPGSDAGLFAFFQTRMPLDCLSSQRRLEFKYPKRPWLCKEMSSRSAVTILIASASQFDW